MSTLLLTKEEIHRLYWHLSNLLDPSTWMGHLYVQMDGRKQERKALAGILAKLERGGMPDA